MLARDIMTTDVCALMPDTSVLEAAQLFVDRRIGGAPVLDDAGQVVGVVSEGDLMRRAELGTERVWSGWREFLAGKDMVAHEFVRSHAFKVGDIMSAPVWTAHEDMPLGEIAALFEKHRIRRLPVVRDGKMVGIVSRADLVRALLRTWSTAHPPLHADDEAIRNAILTQAAAARWGDPPRARALLPAVAEGHESLLHDSGAGDFWLWLADHQTASLLEPRLERLIGAVYHPETERTSHTLMAQLAGQFDVLVHVDETHASTFAGR